MRLFGCPITILNTLDPLGKFNGKEDEGFLVGYSIYSKAFRVFNSRTKIIQETLHINFLENQPNVAGSRPKWLFDIDTLTQSMNYQLVVTRNQPNHNASIKENLDAYPQNTDADAAFDVKENKSKVHVSPSSGDKKKKHDEKAKKEAKGKSLVDLSTGVRDLRDGFEKISVNSTNRVNAASVHVTAVGPNPTNSTNSFNAASPFDNAYQVDEKDRIKVTADDLKLLLSGKLLLLKARNVDNASKFLMYPRFLQVMIDAQVDDLSSHTTKYTSPKLTQKFFANMRRIGKGFSGIETPLFDTMLVQLQVQDAAKVEEDEDDIEIVKLKKRVKKLEKKRRSKSSGLKRSRKVGRMEEDATAVKEINAAEPEPTIINDEEMQEKHLDNIKKYQSLKRKPFSVAQARKNMIVYLKNMVRYKIQHFKVVEFKMEALQVKYPFIDWEIYFEGSRTYWRIIRVGGITQAYRSFEDMVKDFDKEDLDALWRLTNEKFSIAMLTEDKEKALWVELKRLYEPNEADVFWKLQRYMHDPLT
nr:retrovirus-related Pol polyprotein from transposon TNT 1-94 [Tanacetum cinerariifolium]